MPKRMPHGNFHSPVPTYVIQQAILEIRYAHGMVYFDRCGSIMNELERQIGAPFKADVPREAAEFASRSERISVMYGPKSFAVTQTWCRTPLRLAELAPQAWGIVSEAMGVHRFVTRCGVRFTLLYRRDSESDAQGAIARSGLIQETGDWSSCFGSPAVGRSFSGTSAEPTGNRVKTTIGTLETIIEDGVPTELAEMVPKHSVLLDVDYMQGGASPGDPTFSVKHSALKDFIQYGWGIAKRSASEVAKRIGDEGAPTHG